jgi:hypothetical protein
MSSAIRLSVKLFNISIFTWGKGPRLHPACLGLTFFYVIANDEQIRYPKKKGLE